MLCIRDASRHLCILAVPKKSDRAESSLRSVDFGLLVIGSDKGAGTATDRGSYGEASTTAGDVEIGPIREADQPSAEVGTLTGALLVATSGRLFNCLEVFGSVEVCVLFSFDSCFLTTLTESTRIR